MKSRIILFSSIIVSQLFVNCSNNEADLIDINAPLYTEVLTNEAVNVITATYTDMYENAKTLKSACDALTIGNETQLEAVKEAWIATRAPWEKSEGFLYGPVDKKGIDPAVDSWPVDINAINVIVSSDNNITSTSLDNDDARGFHTIEYFVWGKEGDKKASELTSRELEYLQAAAENLYEKASILKESWLQSGDNFASNFINAGESGSAYKSQVSALEEIVEGLIIIADEVGNGKIENPLNGDNGEAKPELEESPFSNNSKSDFANNIRSIQNIYLGDYKGKDGKGITDIVALTNTALDAEIKEKTIAAIKAIEEIPGTFTDAIFNSRSEVEAAQTKIGELHDVLNEKLKPLISNL